MDLVLVWGWSDGSNPPARSSVVFSHIGIATIPLRRLPPSLAHALAHDVPYAFVM
jgi:hypothetical protein